VKCNWSRIQSNFFCIHQDSVKKNCLLLNLFHKFCLRRNFFIKNLETVCLRISDSTKVRWMEQFQTSWSRKNSVRQQVEWFSHSKNLRVAETWGKWKMYFTLISLSTHWGLKAHTLFHCLLSSGPEAHTFVWVIPQRPTPYFTVHSVGCLQPTPSFEWFLQRLHQSEGGFTVWGVPPKNGKIALLLTLAILNSRKSTSLWRLECDKSILGGDTSNRKIGDWKKLEILVQNQWFWNIVSARPTASTSQQRER